MKTTETYPLPSSQTHQVPVVPMARWGARVAGLHPSSAAKPGQPERPSSRGGGTWETDLTLSRQNGAINSPVSCLSTDWAGFWQQARHLGQLCPVVSTATLQVESLVPQFIFFRDLRVSARSWGLCPSQLFPLSIWNTISADLWWLWGPELLSIPELNKFCLLLVTCLKLSLKDTYRRLNKALVL